MSNGETLEIGEIKERKPSLEEEMLKYRIIFCDDIIVPDSAKELWAHLFQLTSGNDRRPITFYINSPGGSLHEGLAMGGILEACIAPVYTIGVAKVCSAALFPFAAGSKRYAYPHTTFLMHDFSGTMVGKLPELRSSVDYLELLKDEILEFLAQRTKMDTEWWALKFASKEKQDYWFSVKEAVEIGLVDGIIQPTATLKLK